MNRRSNLSVEIFHDLHTPGIAVDPVLTSLDGIAKLANAEFDILQTTRRIRIAAESSEAIQTHKINWQTLPADINIVLSERPIASDPSTKIFGETAIQFGPDLGTRVCVISTHENNHLVTVATHEICHTLNLKHSGATYDGTGHCTEEHCLMHATINEQVSTREKKPASFKERVLHLLDGPLYEPEFTLKNNTPCMECIKQIGSHTLLLTEAKNGRFIPRHLIFPFTRL